MNLVLALWQINPAAEYLTNETQDQIAEWRGPGEQPTPEELDAAWAAYLRMVAAWESHPRRDPVARSMHHNFTLLGLLDHPDSWARFAS